MNDHAYLARKHREMELIAACFDAPVAPAAPLSAAQAIDEKFRLAGALRAERSRSSWAITETARPEIQRWRVGSYAFSFGYQRADLQVRGPAIYSVPGAHQDVRSQTLYTGSGMSAIAVVFSALLRLRDRLHVFATRGFYSETRELLESFGPCVTVTHVIRRFETTRSTAATASASRARTLSAAAASRILLLDSCVSDGFDAYRDLRAEDFDVVVFDTTCFPQTSARIRNVVEWSLRTRVPLALVRSHAKLDALGIEYGRLGSVVLLWRRAHAGSVRMRDLARAAEASVRLYGVAAIPAHFPPFTGTDAYRRASRARTAAIIGNTRRAARRLATALGRDCVRTFQHGLYLALVPGRDMQLDDVKHAADDLCRALIRRGLPVKHAGSFGFDFVAVEWFYDAIARRNVIRVSGADLPWSLVEPIVGGIEAWWFQHRMSVTPALHATVARQQQSTVP
jgi:hypothetical protein